MTRRQPTGAVCAPMHAERPMGLAQRSADTVILCFDNFIPFV